MDLYEFVGLDSEFEANQGYRVRLGLEKYFYPQLHAFFRSHEEILFLWSVFCDSNYQRSAPPPRTPHPLLC